MIREASLPARLLALLRSVREMRAELIALNGFPPKKATRIAKLAVGGCRVPQNVDKDVRDGS